MGVSFIIFVCAVVGLTVLFLFKFFEERGRHVAALSAARTAGDVLIEDGFIRYAKLYHAHARKMFEQAVHKAREAHKKAEVFTLTHTQRATSRLHEFLLRRRVAVERKAGHVSEHLKTVLKKETPPPDLK